MGDSFFGISKKPYVAVVDDFSTKAVSVDRDNIPDVAHGVVVKRFVEEGLPGAKIDTFDIGAVTGPALRTGVNSQLDAVIENIDKKKKKYDAVNISAGSSWDFASVSKLMEKPITPENILQNKDEITKTLSEITQDPGCVEIVQIIKKLDKITSYGIPVYISAGNEGKGKFNLFTLSGGVKSVGALDATGQKGVTSGNNSLVSVWESGVFSITRLADKKGRTGFDYTGDGTIDIFDKDTSTTSKAPYPLQLVATSVSAPRALIKDLKKK